MAAAASEQDGAITAINVTPLVDIILVVLIIFMATAPLIQRRAMKVDLPKAAHHEKTATSAVRVTLNAKHVLLVAGQAMSLKEMKARLASAVAAEPGLRLTMAADKTLPYGEVIAVIDAARGAGVRRIGLEVRQK
ncbi:MAG: biopolymer transporter ExbD [Elusimicrobia bacterium]|nr:biopolymer transporter ExbD [Elusimicrobiota bacterium]MDE2236483.1 biopolymer transporter ExbD [Elusimicrobiota bacterium]MDE2425413.1 biopolymer transporter ExbD [Elusimicrobiota bacterium]